MLPGEPRQDMEQSAGDFGPARPCGRNPKERTEPGGLLLLSQWGSTRSPWRGANLLRLHPLQRMQAAMETIRDDEFHSPEATAVCKPMFTHRRLLARLLGGRFEWVGIPDYPLAGDALKSPCRLHSDAVGRGKFGCNGNVYSLVAYRSASSQRKRRPFFWDNSTLPEACALRDL